MEVYREDANIYLDFIEDCIITGGGYTLKLNDAYHKFRQNHRFCRISKPTFLNNMSLHLGEMDETRNEWIGYSLKIEDDNFTGCGNTFEFDLDSRF